MENQLKELWIQFDIFPAVDWNLLTDDYLKNCYDWEKCKQYIWRHMTRWEIWCALSHLEIYKKIIKENIDNALILEDDVMISNSLKKYINLFTKKSNDWDYLSLTKQSYKSAFYYVYNKYYRNWKYLMFFISSTYRLIQMIFYNILYFISHIFWVLTVKHLQQCWTRGYFISYEWAKKLLNIHNKVFVPSDVLPYKFKKQYKLRFWYFVPSPLNINIEFKSDIGDNRL